MKAEARTRNLFHRHAALIVLASAIAIPALAQSAPVTQPDAQPAASPSVQQPAPAAAPSSTGEKEGFWGHVNPFARKKWVNKRVDPLKDRLNELDEVNAKNARDIQDVDGRAQAGIRKAQSTADTANQAASAAGDQAGKASAIAQSAAGRVDSLGQTVNGMDRYRVVSEVDVTFRGGQPVLSPAARKQLDDVAAGLAGQHGYLIEIEGHSPAAGSIGIQNSARLAEAAKRYLVTEHQIPVFRLHSVALGNSPAGGEGNDPQPVKASSVHIRLMENSLAAQGATMAHNSAPLN
jgi:outer membrane protein OmpA-like peptidoglycan-associated protein